MIYSARFYRPDIIVSGKTSTITLSLYDEDGTAVSLTGTWTWQLFDFNGDSLLSKTATISGDTATVTVSPSDTTDLTLGDEYTSEWSSSALSDSFANDAAVTLRDLYCPITVSDLYSKEPSLRHVQHRDTIDNDSVSIDWSEFIISSYKDMYDQLCAVHRWPWLTLNSRVFRPWLINYTLSQIFRSLGSDRQYEAETYARMAKESWDSISMKVDDGYDRKVSKDTKSISVKPYIRLYTV